MSDAAVILALWTLFWESATDNIFRLEYRWKSIQIEARCDAIIAQHPKKNPRR
ncbi:MAG: hypothetical protein ACLUKN_08010 [Bacilli bacterium]